MALFLDFNNMYRPKNKTEITLTGFVANWSTVRNALDLYEFDHSAKLWDRKKIEDLFYNRHFFGDIENPCHVFFDLLVPKYDISIIRSRIVGNYAFELVSRCYTTSFSFEELLPIDLRGKFMTIKGIKYSEHNTYSLLPDIDWIKATEVKIHPIDIEKVFFGFEGFGVDFLSKTADTLWMEKCSKDFDLNTTADFILDTRPETMNIPYKGISDHWSLLILEGFENWRHLIS